MPEMTDKSRKRVMRAMGGTARCAHGGMPSSCPTCMAKGGEIGSKDGPTSIREKIEQSPRAMPPKRMAEGGDVEGRADPIQDDAGGDTSEDAMLESCAGELVDALQAKDKRGIVDALRALILSCKE